MADKNQVDELRQARGATTTRVSGHELRYEGAPYVSARRPIRTRDRYGFGLCSCGERSEVVSSNAKRKQWHRQHKLDVLTNQRESTDG